MLLKAHIQEERKLPGAKIQLEPGQFVTGRHAAAAELNGSINYLGLLETS